MDFGIQQDVTPFVKSQFPAFFQSYGPNFILFMQAYYEWMSQTGNPLGAARNLLNYRDIDNTLDEFLSHFQSEYLYGIPFNVIINKRYLLKHILDVYRAKGSITCFKLLFKLIYNEDVEVYIPSYDMLLPSDGTWKQPMYLELIGNSVDDIILDSYLGQAVIGLSSGVTAVVESATKEPINQTLLTVFNISNMSPPNKSFEVGEKLLLLSDYAGRDDMLVTSAPTIVGSLDSLEITQGGIDFSVGQVLQVQHTDANSSIISHGIGGLLRITATESLFGSVFFDLVSGGFDQQANAGIYIYNQSSDNTGHGASFQIGTMTNTTSITFNSDIIAPYANVVLNSPTFGFVGNAAANISSPIDSALSFAAETFGSINSLAYEIAGNNYVDNPYVSVRTVIDSAPLQGNVSWVSNSKIITGVGTYFTSAFSDDDLVAIAPNSASIVLEKHVIYAVTNDTSITLWDYPKSNSTTSAIYEVCPDLAFAQFGYANSRAMVNTDLRSSNTIVLTVKAHDSGRGYQTGESITAYLYNSIADPEIILGGSKYSNGDVLSFSDNNTDRAVGYVITDGNGSVVNTAMTYRGSGYPASPQTFVMSKTGSGANLVSSLIQVDTFSGVMGSVVKSGVGVAPGYWDTTQGFLNSDKYIQDSYFYQVFSYQLQAAIQLQQYRDILYNTFHPAGSEMFGEFCLNIVESSPMSVLADPTVAGNSIPTGDVRWDSTVFLLDETYVTFDAT